MRDERKEKQERDKGVSACVGLMNRRDIKHQQYFTSYTL